MTARSLEPRPRSPDQCRSERLVSAVRPCPSVVSNPGMGIHASMDFLGAGQYTGVDLPACRNLIRWVPGISEYTEETAARQKQSANASFDPRVLFEAS